LIAFSLPESSSKFDILRNDFSLESHEIPCEDDLSNSERLKKSINIMNELKKTTIPFILVKLINLLVILGLESKIGTD